jgi:hypothetical protein
MRLLSALALTVVAVLAAVFSSCESGNGAPEPPTFDALGVNPHNPSNDANMPPGDIFVPEDAPAPQFDGPQIGQPDALF